MKLDELKAAWNVGSDHFNRWDSLGVDEMVQFAQQQEREACAKMCEPTTAELLLLAGEMTPSELRTARAVLMWLARRMRSNV